MIDQYTYELLKRIHEFPCEWDKSQFEYTRFEAKYRAIYGEHNAFGKLYSQLKSLEYLDIPRNTNRVDILFTKQGFDAIREYEEAIIKNNQKYRIEEENLKLQNEQFHYQNQLRTKENEIRDLNLQNLRLQNKQLKNKILYAIIGGAIIFILSNWKDILILLKIIDK